MFSVAGNLAGACPESDNIKPLSATGGRSSLRLKVIYFEPQNKEPQNIEVKNMVLFFQKLLLFEIPCSIFDIQNAKQAKAVRLKGEGFEPGEWKKKQGSHHAKKSATKGFNQGLQYVSGG
jgi:hypothetical protein